MQKRRFYVRLCYGMLFFFLLFFSLLLNELNAVIQRTDRGLPATFSRSINSVSSIFFKF